MGDGPSVPDYAEAAREGIVADVTNFPFRYQIEALARMGGRAVIGGQEHDFTGLGDADNAAVMSDEMAQALLDIQRNYGAAFVEQRLKELERADPAGYAARRQLFERIKAGAAASPDRPLAESLQAEINAELTKGGALDKRQLEEVQQGVRGKQISRGITLGNAAINEEGKAVATAGETMRSQRQQSGLNYLGSGVSPEDVEYRRIQQSLQNLGAFISGQTPTAQFRSLSSASNGAAPFYQGQPNQQTTNPNAGQQGVNNALAIYSGNVNWSNSQVNPWIAGLSTGASALRTMSNLGWNSSGITNASNWQNYGQNTNPHNASYLTGQ